MKTCWINLYAQGYYHRAGKPGTMNAHPGDMYESYELARADIDQEAPYLATVAVFVPDTVAGLATYPKDSTPIPMGSTRIAWKQGTVGITVGGVGTPHLRSPGQMLRPISEGVGLAKTAAIPVFGEADSLEQADA